MGMTIGKRLARSNIAMLVIPILAAALLLLLGLGAALLLLRGNLMTLHDAVEQMETVLHGFKLTLNAFAAIAVHMNRLREKLEDDPSHPKLLQTVWGVGYRLTV